MYVEGSIRTHSYDDKDGNKRYMTEIIAQRVQFLGGGGGAGSGAGAAAGRADPAPPRRDARRPVHRRRHPVLRQSLLDLAVR